MRNKNLNDIKLALTIDNEICIAQVKETTSSGLMISDNKKIITQDFLNMMMRYCSETCNNEESEWESPVGIIKFIPKER
ncbi:hypothetical protein [Clostridium botulinum]|uniref:hypothetical protein n=1 Tax=Clostridium botulinum TaxID=1491 RepID=UPI001C9A428F|nr:hypothetical protein [Clostridium botulinum]MBY6838691.1 hypothetical protein [Clostridium botulinum]